MSLYSLVQIASFAIVDSINVLLIAVLFIVRVDSKQARKRIIPSSWLLIASDFTGVLFAAALVSLLIRGAGWDLRPILDSAWFGVIFVALGLVAARSAVRGDSSVRLAKAFSAYVTGSPGNTILLGVSLGVVQSLTSGPFWGGLVVISASVDVVVAMVVTLVFYSMVALLVPVIFEISLCLFPLSRRITLDYLASRGMAAIAVLLLAIGSLHLLSSLWSSP